MPLGLAGGFGAAAGGGALADIYKQKLSELIASQDNAAKQRQLDLEQAGQAQQASQFDRTMAAKPEETWSPVGQEALDPNTGQRTILAISNRGNTRQLGLAAPKEQTSESADNDRYISVTKAASMGQPVSPDDKAWATAYASQKTLGPQASAAAAADRQAKTLQQQIDQQGRAQDFAEAQAGRAELTNKVEQPYLTAQNAAGTFRDVIASAKAGNKFSASQQALEGAMTAIRGQGLNRINSTEVGVAGNAGSLWDKIEGWAGKQASGQPVPPDIQDAMSQFADILDKAAYKKYSEGWDTTTGRYKLADERKIAPSGAPAKGTSSVDGKTVWDYRNNQWGWWPK